MKAVIFSINRPHTDNIKSGAKGSELRTKPPKIIGPYKAFIYETKKNGGCGKVIGEFTAYNESTYRMCMGVPKHLVLSGCISVEDIWAYTNKGQKDLTEISISNLVIYDKPRELSNFYTVDIEAVRSCKNRHQTYHQFTDTGYIKNGFYCEETDDWCTKCKTKPITRPPQSWCYIESEVYTE
jgi:predicted transcriptional regulator